MKYQWEADWAGKRISVELVTASLADALVKRLLVGLIGAPKARGTLLYGKELVESRELNQSLLGADAIESLDLVGTAKDLLGDQVVIHARIIPGTDQPSSYLNHDCKVSVNGEAIPVQKGE